MVRRKFAMEQHRIGFESMEWESLAAKE